MSDIYETISSYIEACAQKSESPHEFIITMLTRDKNENLLEPSLECFLKLCGNNYVHTKIRLQDHNLPSLCTTLVNNSYITGLDLRYNQITDKGAILLANMMKENRFIRELNLRCNDISHDGGVAIADMLHVNQTLLILIMAGNKIGDKAALKFAHSLQINNTLKSLDLGECDMKIDSVIAMATVLNYNHSLKRIILNRPLLWTHQEETTVHMGEMLVRNKGLQALHLEKYDMRDFGVERLCDGFVNNCHLRVLDLGANRMTREGARALAKALERNTTLEVLDVSCNRIHDDGAVALADVLTTTNRQLKVLVVSYNELTDRGLVSLANCLHHNSVLTCLYIWGNEMNEPACDAFHELLSIGRLLEANCDVRSYQVDGRNYLAALSHDCDYRRFRFSVPVYGPEVPSEISLVLFKK